MKKWMISCFFAVLFISTAFAQYRTERSGYEGDYFSLEGALDLFKRSTSPEDFERRLNSEENWVNNLDLNYDGRIDYIRVEHLREGRNFHAIVLQAVLDRYEAQDVAVIEIEVTGRRRAVLQIVGDEDLYGESVVVEPVEGYAYSSNRYSSGYDRYVNVYYWDAVQYILCPRYRVYASPYRWDYYPVWWRPWGPWSWDVFHPRVVIYVNHYHVVHTHRVVRVHNFYRNHRSYSYNVVQQCNEVRVHHGKPPVHRPKPDRQVIRERTETRSRKDYERTSDHTPPPVVPNRPPVNRKQDSPSVDRNINNGSSGRNDHASRNTVERPNANRSTLENGSVPPVSRNRTAPVTDPKPDRETVQRTRPSTDHSIDRSGTSRKEISGQDKPSGRNETGYDAGKKRSGNVNPKVEAPSRNSPARPPEKPKDKKPAADNPSKSRGNASPAPETKPSPSRKESGQSVTPAQQKSRSPQADKRKPAQKSDKSGNKATGTDQAKKSRKG